MKVHPYERREHFTHLEEWVHGWTLPETVLKEIPKYGFVASEKGIVYAAAFLRLVEKTNTVLLDGLIANPKTSGKARYHALNRVVEACIDKAKFFGSHQILAYSVDVGTLKRSLRFGFQAMPHQMIVLRL